MNKLLIEPLVLANEEEHWALDRPPQMPLLGFVAGSLFSLAIWGAVLCVALTIAG